MTTQKELFKQLEKAKVNRNDTLLLHSSMKQIGEFEGGIEGLINTFRDYLCDGLFILPTHTWHIVDKKHPVFDVRLSMPCTGIIPTTAVNMKGGIRSLNPTHSIVAFGKDAEEYVGEESKIDTPTPKKGCYGKLYERGAVIMLAGVNHNKNTYIHCVEEMANLQNRLTSDYTLFYDIDESGVKHEHKMKEIFCPYHEDVSHEFMRLKNIIEKSGADTNCKIGKAESISCRVRPLTDILLYIMNREKAQDKDYLINELYQQYKNKG